MKRIGWVVLAIVLPLAANASQAWTPTGGSAEFCRPDASGKYLSEAPAIQTGQGNGYYFGHGGGCILRPLREVWAVAMNHELMKWNGVDEFTYQDLTPTGGAVKDVRIHYTVHRFIFTVSWDMDWISSVLAGTIQDPDQLEIDYRKVSGTSHIRLWQGSMHLVRLAQNVTGITMDNAVDADQTDQSDAGDTIKDVILKLRTGAPNWRELPQVKFNNQ